MISCPNNQIHKHKQASKNQMSSKDKKIVQERVKIPAHGDEKIEEAKGILE